MLKLMADVESQYLSLLEAKEMFFIAKESLELSKKNEETAKIKFDSGLISEG
jgi:outer membrane protein TolC